MRSTVAHSPGLGRLRQIRVSPPWLSTNDRKFHVATSKALLPEHFCAEVDLIAVCLSTAEPETGSPAISLVRLRTLELARSKQTPLRPGLLRTVHSGAVSFWPHSTVRYQVHHGR